MITSETISEKCELLDPSQRETVFEFIDFLLHKHQRSCSDKRDLLLQTSVWSEEDIRPIEEVQKDINRWQLPKLS